MGTLNNPRNSWPVCKSLTGCWGRAELLSTPSTKGTQQPVAFPQLHWLSGQTLTDLVLSFLCSIPHAGSPLGWGLTWVAAQASPDLSGHHLTQLWHQQALVPGNVPWYLFHEAILCSSLEWKMSDGWVICYSSVSQLDQENLDPEGLGYLQVLPVAGRWSAFPLWSAGCRESSSMFPTSKAWLPQQRGSIDTSLSEQLRWLGHGVPTSTSLEAG